MAWTDKKSGPKCTFSLVSLFRLSHHLNLVALRIVIICLLFVSVTFGWKRLKEGHYLCLYRLGEVQTLAQNNVVLARDIFDFLRARTQLVFVRKFMAKRSFECQIKSRLLILEINNQDVWDMEEIKEKVKGISIIWLGKEFASQYQYHVASRDWVRGAVADRSFWCVSYVGDSGKRMA